MSNKKTKRKVPWLLPGIRRPNYHLPRYHFKLGIKIPPYTYIILAFSLIFYIFSGGVYYSVTPSVPAYGTNSQGEIELVRWDPTLKDYYTIEGLAAGLFIFMGVLGLYFIKIATSEPHNPSRASTFQMIGILLLLIAFISLSSMFSYKTQKKKP